MKNVIKLFCCMVFLATFTNNAMNLTEGKAELNSRFDFVIELLALLNTIPTENVARWQEISHDITILNNEMLDLHTKLLALYPNDAELIAIKDNITKGVITFYQVTARLQLRQTPYQKEQCDKK